jgi:hypothetical protein
MRGFGVGSGQRLPKGRQRHAAHQPLGAPERDRDPGRSCGDQLRLALGEVLIDVFEILQTASVESSVECIRKMISGKSCQPVILQTAPAESSVRLQIDFRKHLTLGWRRRDRPRLSGAVTVISPTSSPRATQSGSAPAIRLPSPHAPACASKGVSAHFPV